MSSPEDGSSRSVQSFDVRLIVDRIPAFTWPAHADGSVEFVNQRWREYAGLSPEESQGCGWQVAIHPEDLPSLMRSSYDLRGAKGRHVRGPDSREGRFNLVTPGVGASTRNQWTG
jgi:PAS domain S-box-containing protein